MKNAFAIVFCFALCCLNPARAQKAYDIINYQASIFGNRTTLQLADGYLLASKATIHSKSGDQVFSPNANEPDNQGDLRLDFVKGAVKFKAGKGSWMILKKINGPEYPLKISAVYWDGKMKTVVIFKRLTIL